MLKIRREITGQKFGKLLVISFDSIRNQKSYWNCRCECGTEKVVCGASLVRGLTVSCGCGRRDGKRTFIKNKNLYMVYNSMVARCTKENNKDYKNYGSRGIKVSEEWKDFKVFQEWALNNGYEKGLTLDRIDNNSGYSKENCRWVTNKENCNNKNNHNLLTYDGTTLNLTQWAEKLGIKVTTLHNRLYRSKRSLKDIIENN